MRARNIKPALFKNELLGSADPLLTILFEGLWCMADREGRLEDRPARIKAEVFPYRSIEVEPLLAWLKRNFFIDRYQAGKRKVIQVLEFLKHQKPHKNEAISDLPANSKKHNLGTKPSTTKVVAARADSLLSERGMIIPSCLIPDSGSSAQPPAASVLEIQRPKNVLKNGFGKDGRDVAAWCEAHAAATSIGFRDPTRTETVKQYMDAVRVEMSAPKGALKSIKEHAALAAKQ